MTGPVFYARPQASGSQVDVAPAVASWDRAGSPGQVRSAAFVDAVWAVVADHVRAARPFALRLDVGLPDTVPLHQFNDLDNYLFPLVPRLSERAGREFVSVWATKRYGATSSVWVGMPVLASDPGLPHRYEVTTTAAAETSAFKEQIRDQITAASPLSGGGVALQLAFVVGPRRVWPNLWKPTIDALGPILGREGSAHGGNPRDGRITDLGLHCAVDPLMGNEVRIAIRASASNESDIP